MQTNLSKALREVVEASGWSQGKDFEIIVKDESILICLASKPRYTLEELIAQCDQSVSNERDQ